MDKIMPIAEIVALRDLCKNIKIDIHQTVYNLSETAIALYAENASCAKSLGERDALIGKMSAENKTLYAEMERLRGNYEALKEEFKEPTLDGQVYCQKYQVGKLGSNVLSNVIADAERLRVVNKTLVDALQKISKGIDRSYPYDAQVLAKEALKALCDTGAEK